MTSKFDAVDKDDFMKFGADRPSYLDIEDALMALGGHGVAGNAFKIEALKLAGWTGGALATYASRSVVAANAFNKVREGLTQTKSADELRAWLQK